MTSRRSFRLFLTVIQAMCLATCGGSSATSPSTSAVADFVTGVTASDGSVAAKEPGTPPAASGGPTLTVTSPGTVSSGGNDAASLQSPAPFQTVYVSVGNATGFYQLQLTAPTTSVTVTDALGSQIPTSTYVVSYQAASAAGLVGPPASVTNSVQAAATVTSIAVTGTAALAVAQTSQLTATASLSNGTTQNVTSSATWQSSNTGVATVSSGGLVSAVAAGTATITATSQGKSGTLTITVTVPTLSLTGVWNLSVTWSSETGDCANGGGDPINTPISGGQTTVSSSGSFTGSTRISIAGTMNLSTGAWSFAVTTGGCSSDSSETSSASGTCSSSAACSGTIFGTSNPGPGTQTGIITWSR